MRGIRLVRQKTPHGCGQACVAMVLRRSFGFAVSLMGHAHQTWTRELVQALRREGVEVPDRLVRGRPSRSSLAIVRVSWYVRGLRQPAAHWCVWDRGRLLDPLAERGDTTVPPGGQITSYLPVSMGA